jgi:hypothetical protein
MSARSPKVMALLNIFTKRNPEDLALPPHTNTVAGEVAPEAARWAGGGGPFVYILVGVIGDPKRGAQERMIY